MPCTHQVIASHILQQIKTFKSPSLQRSSNGCCSHALGFQQSFPLLPAKAPFPLKHSTHGSLETCMMKTWCVIIIRRWTKDLLFNMEIYAVPCAFYETKFWHFPFFLSSKFGFIQSIVIVPPSRIGECSLTLMWRRSREEGSHLMCIFFPALLFAAAAEKQCFPPPSFPLPRT